MGKSQELRNQEEKSGGKALLEMAAKVRSAVMCQQRRQDAVYIASQYSSIEPGMEKVGYFVQQNEIKDTWP